MRFGKIISFNDRESTPSYNRSPSGAAAAQASAQRPCTDTGRPQGVSLGSGDIHGASLSTWRRQETAMSHARAVCLSLGRLRSPFPPSSEGRARGGSRTTRWRRGLVYRHPRRTGTDGGCGPESPQGLRGSHPRNRAQHRSSEQRLREQGGWMNSSSLEIEGVCTASQRHARK